MNYAIQIWALGTYPQININKEEFDKLRQSRQCLSNALAIEEKYELLLSNYSDLEKECLNVTSDSMLRNDIGYANIFEIRLTFNRRIVNLLTSTKLYIDQIQQHVKACIPEDADITEKIKALFSNEYDAHFEYRFMEALRNYVQHRGLAVHSTMLGSRWTSHEDNGELEYTTRLFTHRSEVESDKAFKKSISNEMPEKVELIYACRIYIEAISKIHCYIRKLLVQVSESSRNLIAQNINEYEETYKKKPFGLSAVCFIPKQPVNEILEKFPLLLEWDNIRIDLIKKNGELKNLRKRFVSSSGSNKTL